MINTSQIGNFRALGVVF